MLVPMLVAHNLLGDKLVVTSGSDGKHMPKSRHQVGLALDFRTRDLTLEEKNRLLSEMQICLGIEYKVILEDDHLHVQFQGRQGSPGGGY